MSGAGLVRIIQQTLVEPSILRRTGFRSIRVSLRYCPLSRCDLCGRFGHGRFVKDYCAVYWFMPGRTKLCTSCWNRVKRLAKKAREIEEIHVLQRQLGRARRGNSR